MGGQHLCSILPPSAPPDLTLLQAEDKIPSSSSLTLELKQVPKMLSHLTGSWCPQAFVVSFKVHGDRFGVACSLMVINFTQPCIAGDG